MARVFLPITGMLAGMAVAGSGGELRFNREIRPILADRCFACHGPDEKTREGDLRLDVREEAVDPKLGAIVPGKPEESELIARIFETDPDEMMPPPNHPVPLKDSEKETLRQWIAEGAKYEGHWAFTRAERSDDRGPAAIDRFIDRQLRAEGMEREPEASRETLIRRLSLDLNGIPPTVGEVDAFLADGSPDAYERLVDRLLASPRYGERMAMWWLDGARYADSHGFQADWERYQWPWRDWVINAFNRNQPFDRFTIEQLAGDLLPGATQDQIVATGFGRNHRINTEGGALDEEWLIENVMDRVETTGSVWLGLTLGCARCHDHKYDPLSQREFYQLFSFFNNIPEQGKGPGRQGNFEPVLKLSSPEQEEQLASLGRRIQETEKLLLPWLPKNQQGLVNTAFGDRGGNADANLVKAIKAIKEPAAAPHKKTVLALRDQRARLETTLPSVMVMKEMPKPRKTHILERGDYLNPREEVHAALPAFLPPLPAGEPMNRLGFARWLVHRDHPLTARVQANRLWELLFGAGLVESSENLGVQADWPSHPELLDWLAVEFMENGWDVKALVKTIVMSSTYRQSSRVDPQKLAKDPKNRLLARGPRFRVQAETVRDQALAIAGLLKEKTGGPSVRPYQPDGIWSEVNFYGNLRNYAHATDGNQYRRSLYTIWKRTAAPPGMTLFDMPSREICTVRRPRTNTPLQALALMNDVTYVEASRKFAERMMAHGSTPAEWLAWGWRQATARKAQPAELDVLTRGYERRLAHYRSAPEAAAKLLKTGESPVSKDADPASLAALAVTASVILNLDEVITRE